MAAKRFSWATLERVVRNSDEPYWLTRFAFLRALGLIYLVAFLSLSRQLPALLGSSGLLPARLYLDSLGAAGGLGASRFLLVPSLFWLGCSDAALTALAWLGVALALAAAAGATNALLYLALWVLYTSFVNIGQVFYGYGWEMMLLEAGFLAVFLCPLRSWRPFPSDSAPPEIVLFLVRWMLFRVMFGAGLIKLRGDPCWRDLSCLLFHYETQPIPNPLSWYFHHLPPLLNRLGVLFNHFVELIVPFWLLAGRNWRRWGAALTALFQGVLILSGNLSFLNWLTLALCIPCWDDGLLGRLLPRAWLSRLPKSPPEDSRFGPRKVTLAALAAGVAVLSISPVLNMLSPGQAMNASFDPLHLVNTYGAFGSVGRRRPEIILEGTRDAALGPGSEWRAYEFNCKPGDPRRRPCFVSPYHYRVDWQIWFAAMQDYRGNPWLIHLIGKLLEGDAAATGLLASSPFPDQPPKFIRAELYEYRFTLPGEGPDWWVRERVGSYLPPLSLDNPSLREFLRAQHGR